MTSVLAILENGPEPYKRPILERVLAAARESVPELRALFVRHELTPDSENLWYRAYFPEEDVLICDLRSPKKSALAIQRALRPREALVGVYTYLEEAVEAANAIAHHYRLPAICHGANASQVRRKDRMRAAVRSALLPHRAPATSTDFVDVFDVEGVRVFQPRWATSTRLAEAMTQWEVWRKSGQDAIIKPVAMGSSLGVATVPHGSSPEELSRLWKRAASVDFAKEYLRMQYAITRDVILETLIPHSAEISVEALVAEGTVHVIAISRKYVGRRQLVEFEEVAHLVDGADEDERRRLQCVLSVIARGLRLWNSAVHAEFLIGDGHITFVELGARLGGDLIPVAVEDATGNRFAAQSVAVCLGHGGSSRVGEALHVGIVKCAAGQGTTTLAAGVEAYRPHPEGPLFLRSADRKALETSLPLAISWE